MASIAQRLVTLCATLGEFPHVRFAADGGGRTEGVARTFQVSSRVVVSLVFSYSFAVLLPGCSLLIRPMRSMLTAGVCRKVACGSVCVLLLEGEGFCCSLSL